MQRQLTATGRRVKPKKLNLTVDDLSRIPDPVDRRACMLLVGASGVYEGRSRYYSSYASPYGSDSRLSSWKVPSAGQSELFTMMAAGGRLHYRVDSHDSPQPVRWSGDELWEFALTVKPLGKTKSFEIRGELRNQGETRSLKDVAQFIPGSPALMLCDGVLCHLESHGCFSWLLPLQRVESARLKPSEVTKFLKELERLGHFPPIEWPADWGVIESADLLPQPELFLKIENPRWDAQNYPARAEVKFRYGDVVVDESTAGRFVVDSVAKRVIHRKPGMERDLLNRFLSLGATTERYGDRFEVHPKKIPTLVVSLVCDGWKVHGNNQVYRQPGRFKIHVSTGIDWFDVAGDVEFGEHSAKLPELLEAINKGERFVPLDDGSFGILPEDWLGRHRAWLGMGEAEDGRIRFNQTQVGLIDALLAEMPEATFDENLAAARKRIAAFDGVKACQEPEDFRGELRPYQREGLGWLEFLDTFQWGGCLADDMGLGKTVQLLAHFARRRGTGPSGPSLVVAPKSVVYNWVEEAKRFAPDLRVLDYTGSDRKKIRTELARHDLVLTTYGTLRRDVKFLREQPFDYVVLDEAQAIKNAESQSAKASRLLTAHRRLALTGTPVENDLSDLWSIFEFLNPGMLGTINAFKNFSSGGRNGRAGAGDHGNGNGGKADTHNNGNGNGHAIAGRNGGDTGRFSILRRMLRPFILRRTKEQVAPELPERSEQTVYCEMPKEQAAYYKELLDHYRASLLARIDKDGLARSKMHVLEALLRLRQAACHPGLIDTSKSGVESAKLESLIAMVTELIGEGHKALIFSQFTKMLAIVRRELDQRGIKYEYLDGKTTDRPRRIEHFQTSKDCPLFLISLKAGGTGLNLTAADYVFILDPWWNPAVEAQAIDRTHRIGQDKKVIAYRLIARDTVESKILELQASKRHLAEAIITQQNSVIRSLTREDLAILLS
jgi:superfamily II DNA or RNA helicase